jgi:hypothetical protein
VISDIVLYTDSIELAKRRFTINISPVITTSLVQDLLLKLAGVKAGAF